MRAITLEVGAAVPRRKSGQVGLPLIKSKIRREVDVTDEDIAAALDSGDAEN